MNRLERFIYFLVLHIENGDELVNHSGNGGGVLDYIYYVRALPENAKCLLLRKENTDICSLYDFALYDLRNNRHSAETSFKTITQAIKDNHPDIQKLKMMEVLDR